MINERIISENFSSAWQEAFPMLNPNFMRVFNESRLKADYNILIPPTGHSDVVAEFAFNIVKTSYKEKIKLSEINRSPQHISEAFESSLITIRSSTKPVVLPDKLTSEELEEGIALAKNIESFIKFLNGPVKISPNFLGHGIINTCNGDISVGNTLVEIKTVNRTFRSKDLKQLLVYLALQNATGINPWVNGALYNPRLGLFCKFNILSLVNYLSANKTPSEAFSELLAMIERDIQIEQKF